MNNLSIFLLFFKNAGIIYKFLFLISQKNLLLIMNKGTYSSVDSGLYCKPHFLQLFKEKGTYNTLTSGSNTPSMTVNVPKSDPVPRGKK